MGGWVGPRAGPDGVIAIRTLRKCVYESYIIAAAVEFFGRKSKWRPVMELCYIPGGLL
jgi:hypothetical protein